MLALAGFLTILVFLVATMSRKVSVLVALVLIPAVAALAVGAGGELGDIVLEGMQKTAPTGILLLFAILYFSLMLDLGLFDPLVSVILRYVGTNPIRISVGTAVLTSLIALDGDGSSTYLIVCAAMLPVYLAVGMSRLSLAAVAALPVGFMNILPWGGPTGRAVAALQTDVTEIFNPLIASMAGAAIWVIIAAYLIGRGEKRRIERERASGVVEAAAGTVDVAVEATTMEAGGATHGQGSVREGPSIDTATNSFSEGQTSTAPPGQHGTARLGRSHWGFTLFNALLTLTLVVTLVAEVLPPAVIFLIGFAVALIVNIPKWDDQAEVLERHGGAVIMVVGLIFAAGSFAGILMGTGMVEGMADVLASAIPDGAGGILPLLVALTSMPLSIVLPPDAYYFGVLPILAETYASMGGDPNVIGRAALMGHTTTGSPLSPLNASTFVLLSSTGVDLLKHQKNLFKWAYMSTLVMTAIAVATGAIVITL